VKSSKQKLVAKSSTEAELIALSDALGQVIWTRNFLCAQGYDLGPFTVLQDNLSTMTMVKNGASTSDRTRHVNIRFFFAKDRVDSGEIKLQYCPAEDMVADLFTKPLQGELFRKLRNRLLNWT
jgi:KUP system potassium uptake protein